MRDKWMAPEWLGHSPDVNPKISSISRTPKEKPER